MFRTKLVLVGLCFSSAALMLAPHQSAIAQRLDVPVMERADADLPTCALGRIAGLKADGDGFLAVRTGPGSKHRKIDELHNGDRVWMYDQRGKWIGIVYDAANPGCGPIQKDRRVPYAGKKGWVHQNWVRLIAG